MSCGTSANAMSLVTQTSRPIRGKGADVMFGLSALSAGSRLQDLTTTTSIKRCLPNLTMLPILPWQIQMLLQLRVFVIQQGGRWWIRKHCWIPHSFSFLPSCLKKAWIHKYPYGFQMGQNLTYPCDMWSFQYFLLMLVIFPPFYPHDASSCGNLHKFAADNIFFFFFPLVMHLCWCWLLR